MAGEARSTNFMLGTAEVMIGPRDKLYELNPEEHSLGLVKNFVAEANKEFTELGQGVQNTMVFSRTTGITARCSCEAYEFTAKNLAYALSLDGTQFAPKPGMPLTLTGVSVNNADGTHTLTVDTPATPQALSVGDYVTLREPQNDNITLAKVQSTGVSLTVEVDIGDTKVFSAGTVVTAANVLAIGTNSEAQEFAAKVYGQMADGTWVAMYYPRVRITSGLSMGFQTDNYGNLPFEFRPMQLVAGDKYYAEFKGRMGHLAVDGIKSTIGAG